MLAKAFWVNQSDVLPPVQLLSGVTMYISLVYLLSAEFNMPAKL